MKRAFISIEQAAERHGIPLPILQRYLVLRELPNGELCGVLQLLFHYTIHVGIDDSSYSRRWCFGDSPLEAIAALLAYNGGNNMPGPWRKDVKNRIRRNPETGVTWPEDEIEPRRQVHGTN